MPREIIENIIKLIGADVIVNAHDITLTGSAMATVDGDKEIAESIINFFGRHLMAKYSDSYIWDTVIYTRMARAGGYDRVVAREWNKRRDKEHVKRILCPQRVHGIWTLAVLRVEGMAQNVPEITIIHSVDTSEEDTDMIHFILEALYMDIHGGVNPSMADIYERGSDRRRAATSAAYLIEAMRRTVMQVNEPTRTLQQIHKYINDTIATYRRRQSPTTLSTDRWDDEADEDGDEPNTDDPPTGRPPKKTRNKNPSGRTQWNSSRTTTLTIDPTTTAHAIVGDGNCLFRALAHWRYGDENQFMQVRKDTAQAIRNAYTQQERHTPTMEVRFKGKMTSNATAPRLCDYAPGLDNLTLEEYIERTTETRGEWGTNIDTYYAAQAYRVNINTYMRRNGLWEITYTYETETTPTGTYHIALENNHYTVLQNKRNDNNDNAPGDENDEDGDDNTPTAHEDADAHHSEEPPTRRHSKRTRRNKRKRRTKRRRQNDLRNAATSNKQSRPHPPTYLTCWNMRRGATADRIARVLRASRTNILLIQEVCTNQKTFDRLRETTLHSGIWIDGNYQSAIAMDKSYPLTHNIRKSKSGPRYMAITLRTSMLRCTIISVYYPVQRGPQLQEEMDLQHNIRLLMDGSDEILLAGDFNEHRQDRRYGMKRLAKANKLTNVVDLLTVGTGQHALPTRHENGRAQRLDYVFTSDRLTAITKYAQVGDEMLETIHVSDHKPITIALQLDQPRQTINAEHEIIERHKKIRLQWKQLCSTPIQWNQEHDDTEPKQDISEGQQSTWDRIQWLRTSPEEKPTQWREKAGAIAELTSQWRQGSIADLHSTAEQWWKHVTDALPLLFPPEETRRSNKYNITEEWTYIANKATQMMQWKVHNEEATKETARKLRARTKIAEKRTLRNYNILGNQENTWDVTARRQLPQFLKQNGFTICDRPAYELIQSTQQYSEMEDDAHGNRYIHNGGLGQQQLTATCATIYESLRANPIRWGQVATSAKLMATRNRNRRRSHFKKRKQFWRITNDTRMLCRSLKDFKANVAGIYKDARRPYHTRQSIKADTERMQRKWLSPHEDGGNGCGQLQKTTFRMEHYAPNAHTWPQEDQNRVAWAHDTVGDIWLTTKHTGLTPEQAAWPTIEQFTDLDTQWHKQLIKGFGPERESGFQVSALGRLTMNMCTAGLNLIKWQLHTQSIANAFKPIKRALTPKPNNGIRPLSLQHDIICFILGITQKALMTTLEDLQVVHPCMFSYRPGRGTTEALITFMTILDVHACNDKMLYIAISDKTKYYDRISHAVQDASLQRLGFPPEGWRAFIQATNLDRLTYSHTPVGIIRIPQLCGYLQGSPLSCTLINETARVQHELWEELPRIQLDDDNSVPPSIGYCDDNILMATTISELERGIELTQANDTVAKNSQNDSKSTIACNQKDISEHTFKTHAWSYEQEGMQSGAIQMEANPWIKYLGLTTNLRGDTSKHIARVQCLTMGKLQKLYDFRRDAEDVRLCYNSIIIPQIQYAVLTAKWTARSAHSVQRAHKLLLMPLLGLTETDTPLLIYLDRDRGGAGITSVTQAIMEATTRELFVCMNRTDIPQMAKSVSACITMGRDHTHPSWLYNNVLLLAGAGIFPRIAHEAYSNLKTAEKIGQMAEPTRGSSQELSVLHPDSALMEQHMLREPDDDETSNPNGWKEDYNTATSYFERYNEGDWFPRTFTPPLHPGDDWYTCEQREHDANTLQWLTTNLPTTMITIATDGSDDPKDKNAHPGWGLTIVADLRYRQTRTYARAAPMPLHWGTNTSTNNMAEGLALCHALRLAFSTTHRVDIFSDSRINIRKIRTHGNKRTARETLRNHAGGISFSIYHMCTQRIDEQCENIPIHEDVDSDMDEVGFNNAFIHWIKAHQNKPPFVPNKATKLLNDKADSIAEWARLQPAPPNIHYIPTGLKVDMWHRDCIIDRDPAATIKKICQDQMHAYLQKRKWQGWQARTNAVINLSHIGWLTHTRKLIQGVETSHARLCDVNTEYEFHTRRNLEPEQEMKHCPFCKIEAIREQRTCRDQRCTRTPTETDSDVEEEQWEQASGQPTGAHYANSKHYHLFCTHTEISTARNKLRRPIQYTLGRLNWILHSRMSIYPVSWTHELDDMDAAWKGALPAIIQEAVESCEDTRVKQIAANLRDTLAAQIRSSANTLQRTISKVLLERMDRTKAQYKQWIENRARNARKDNSNQTISPTTQQRTARKKTKRCKGQRCCWERNAHRAGNWTTNANICGRCERDTRVAHNLARVEKLYRNWTWVSDIEHLALTQDIRTELRQKGIKYVPEVWNRTKLIAAWARRRDMTYTEAIIKFRAGSHLRDQVEESIWRYAQKLQGCPNQINDPRQRPFQQQPEDILLLWESPTIPNAISDVDILNIRTGNDIPHTVTRSICEMLMYNNPNIHAKVIDGTSNDITQITARTRTMYIAILYMGETCAFTIGNNNTNVVTAYYLGAPHTKQQRRQQARLMQRMTRSPNLWKVQRGKYSTITDATLNIAANHRHAQMITIITALRIATQLDAADRYAPMNLGSAEHLVKDGMDMITKAALQSRSTAR